MNFHNTTDPRNMQLPPLFYAKPSSSLFEPLPHNYTSNPTKTSPTHYDHQSHPSASLVTPIHSPPVHTPRCIYYSHDEYTPPLKRIHTTSSSDWEDMESAARVLLSFSNSIDSGSDDDEYLLSGTKRVCDPLPSPPSPVPYEIRSPLIVRTPHIQIVAQTQSPTTVHSTHTLNTYVTQIVNQYGLDPSSVHASVVRALVFSNPNFPVPFETLVSNVDKYSYLDVGMALDDLVDRHLVILRFLCHLQYSKVWNRLTKGCSNLTAMNLVVCGKFAFIRGKGFRLEECFAVVIIPQDSAIRNYFADTAVSPTSAISNIIQPAIATACLLQTHDELPNNRTDQLAIPTSLLSCTTKGRRRFLRYKSGQVYVHGSEIPALATVSVTYPEYTRAAKDEYLHAVDIARWSGRPAEAIKYLIQKGPKARTPHRELMLHFDTTANLSTLTVAFMYAWARPLLPVRVFPWNQVPGPVRRALLNHAQVHACASRSVHVDLPNNPPAESVERECLPDNVHACLAIGLECEGLENPNALTSVPPVNERRYYVREFFVLKIRPPNDD